MFESYISNALFAGICVAIIGGGLGCFVVWKKMAYFGDSLSHSSLLGIALGIALGINTTIGTFLVCSVFAGLLVYLQNKKIFSNDTLLGILAHSSLSIGIVSISLLNKKVNLDSYLFGDILTVTSEELLWFFISTLLVIIALSIIWNKLVLMTIDENIAKSENINTNVIQTIFLTLLIIFVATCVKIVGILLITSMLIIPAASAQQISNSPLQMGINSSIIGILSIILGLYSSVLFDTPTGPTIIVMLVIIFTIIFPISKIKST
ncbi:MAG: metal ABC transporter permease [Thermodesulfobacteriota bacteirum]|jgi:zinc transport system permease protein|nr:metal ABC transporter permease [Thermodesulfobacteriota bacterium]